MLTNKRKTGIGQGSSIPQSTPKHKPESDPEAAKETATTSIHHGRQATYALRGPTRKQLVPPSSESTNKQSVDPSSTETIIPQPGLSRLAKQKSTVNPAKLVSGDGTLCSKVTTSDSTSVPSSKGYTDLAGPAAKSNVDLKKHGRSRSRLIPSGVSNPQSKSSNHGSVESRTEAPAAPGRNVSQTSMRSLSSVSVPRDPIAEYDQGLPEEIRHIQRELLKLHVLHSASANNHEQWRASARTHFQKRFGALKERHMEIADIAYQTQELKNRSALVDWCRNTQGPAIGKRVHVLSRCIHEVYNDVDSGGPYTRTVQTFQTWYDGAQAIRESRKQDTTQDTPTLGYVEEIGAAWQNDVNALQRRLGTLTGDLRALGSANASSNLGQILVLLHDLVIDMLTELDCIRSIEGEVIAQERLWFDEQIATLSLKVHNEMEGGKHTPCRDR
ncbi:MAG: hypothetical protein Q9168_003175 [Polycauliona sp. 1 TL-2023]